MYKDIPIYQVSNCYNESSSQLYPLHIVHITRCDIPGKYKERPVITLQIHCITDDGHYVTKPLIARYDKEHKLYCTWGRHRFYEGYFGPVRLVGVPSKLIDTLNDLGKRYGTVAE